MILFALFLAIPLIEIALFISVGGVIGLWPTLAIVVLTAIAGTILVRRQGFAVLRQVQGSLDQMQDPTEPLAHGAMILFSGALLLTPGFFTDAVGFALLVPGFRAAAFRIIKARLDIQRMRVARATSRFRAGGRDDYPGGRSSDDDVIEADYTDLDKPDGPSGWTKR